MASPGLQALILCGPGSSFSTFTSNPEENPKALLPIANRPMVWYPLDFCYRTGITNITLICPPSISKAIEASLKLNPALTSLPLPSPDVLAPEGLELTTGTAELLRLPEVRELVKSDFIVLPCDLVCELGGERLLQSWMVKSASLSQLLSIKDEDHPAPAHSGGLGVWYQTKTENPIKGEETDFLATTPLASNNQLSANDSLLPHLSNVVMAMPTDSLNDKVEEADGFTVRHSLLRAHSRVRMLTTRRDAHIYIFPRWVMDFVNENETFESIGEDVIGWWAKAGWQIGLRKKLHLDKVFSDPEPEEADPVSPTLSVTPEIQDQQSKQESDLIAAMQKHESASAPQDIILPPFLAYVHPSSPTTPLIRRVDTANLLRLTSLYLAKLPSIEEAGKAASPYAHQRKVAYPEGVKARTTITKGDSLVGDNVTVEEKCAVKESVVGANCQLREGARLTGCLLMEGVVVGKNCRLTRCILGKRCEIGDGCVLADCEVQENLLVEPKTEDKDSKLMSSSGLEATEEEMQEFMDDDDDLEEAVVG